MLQCGNPRAAANRGTRSAVTMTDKENMQEEQNCRKKKKQVARTGQTEMEEQRARTG